MGATRLRGGSMGSTGFPIELILYINPEGEKMLRRKMRVRHRCS